MFNKLKKSNAKFMVLGRDCKCLKDLKEKNEGQDAKT
jgi:hypothetical protein